MSGRANKKRKRANNLPTTWGGLALDADKIRALLKEKDKEIARLNGEVARLNGKLAQASEGKVAAERACQEQVVRMERLDKQGAADRVEYNAQLEDIGKRLEAAVATRMSSDAKLAKTAAELVETKAALKSCKQKVVEKRQKCATLRDKVSDMTVNLNRCNSLLEAAEKTAELAKEAAEKQIKELQRNLTTERQLGVAEGKGDVAATTAVVKQYESEMRKLHQKNDQLKKQIENMMPVYNTASAFAAAVHGGVPVQKSIADKGPVIQEVEA